MLVPWEEVNHLSGIDFQYCGSKGKREVRREGKVDEGGRQEKGEELWLPRSLQKPRVCLVVCTYCVPL